MNIGKYIKHQIYILSAKLIRTSDAAALAVISCLFSNKRSTNNSRERLLLVRLDAIGDFVVWLDSAKYYRTIYPDNHVVLVANSAWSELAFQLGYWDEVWSVDRKAFTRNPLYRWCYMARIYRAGFNTAIQPSFSRLSIYGDSVIRASSAACRIASSSDSSDLSRHDRIRSNRWYTNLLPASPGSLMELERNIQFVQHLGLKSAAAGLVSMPKLAVDLSRFKLTRPYYIISIGASDNRRKWPVEKYGEVARRISRESTLLPVVCGGKSDMPDALRLIDLLNFEVLNLTGSTSLSELCEIIRNARFLIGNESASVHLASAVHTDSICILGGGHFGRFVPYSEKLSGIKPIPVSYPMECYGCNWSCTINHNCEETWPCIDLVSIRSVKDAVDQVILRDTHASKK